MALASPCFGFTPDPSGTPGNDVFVGGPGMDAIDGHEGDDGITSLSGNDFVCGNQDDDHLDGGDGTDQVTGDENADTRNGGVHGGSAADTLYGKAGDDRLQGEPGIDNILGGMGNDTMTATVATIVGLLILWGASALAGSRSSTTESLPSSQVLLGNELAKSLGLTAITTFPVTDCHYFAEARDLETGEIFPYCLDGVVDDDLSFTQLAIMFKGRMPTTADERIFNLQEQLTQLPDDSSYDAQRASIAAEIMSLQASQG